MARFHELEVTALRKTTRDAVVLTLTPRNPPEAFAYTPGQYLTFRRDFDGQELRRSYSISSGLDDGALEVAIKRVEGGAFSTWANDELREGDVLESMEPMGSFGFLPDAGARNEYLGFAGGSGITPVMSIIRSTLAREPGSSFTLVYANRSVNSIMFREELEDLKNLHMGRFNVIHVLEQDAQEIDLFTGQVSEDKARALIDSGWIDVAHADSAYICGPEPMMLGISSALRKAGMADEAIRFELFASAQPGRLPQRARAGGQESAAKAAEVALTLDGATRTITAEKNQSLLDAALEAQIDAPYACKAGVCSTCRCRVTEGEVEMVANHALEDYEVEAGYVLSCQAYPLSDRVALDYDQ